MLARALLGSVSLACIVAYAGDARAFCRTTTVPAPPGYDPAVSGCWTEGQPIAWLWNERIPYQLASVASRQITLADATRLADLAFDAWAQADCGAGHPNVAGIDDGPVPPASVALECPSVPCDPTFPAPYHLIVFRDDAWAYDDPANTLALTTVTYADDSGILFDAEIEINSHDHALSADEPPPRGKFDLRALLTHEAGHFLGLAHATDMKSVMYAYYSPGSIELTADDVAGVCAVYPPQLPPGGCSEGPRPSRGEWPASAGLGVAILATVAGFRRLRRR